MLPFLFCGKSAEPFSLCRKTLSTSSEEFLMSSLIHSQPSLCCAFLVEFGVYLLCVIGTPGMHSKVNALWEESSYIL